MENELKSLLVSGKEIDQRLVAQILKPFIQIDSDTCEIRPLSSWNDLKANNKILLFLVARKAMKALDLPLQEESSSATEIMQNTGLKKGTVNPALRDLLNRGVIAQSKERKYYVANYSIEKVKSMIMGK